MTITAEIQPRGDAPPEGFGPEGTSTGSRAQRFEDACKVAQEEYKRKMESHSTMKVDLPVVREATTLPKLTPKKRKGDARQQRQWRRRPPLTCRRR